MLNIYKKCIYGNGRFIVLLSHATSFHSASDVSLSVMWRHVASFQPMIALESCLRWDKCLYCPACFSI